MGSFTKIEFSDVPHFPKFKMEMIFSNEEPDELDLNKICSTYLKKNYLKDASDSIMTSINEDENVLCKLRKILEMKDLNNSDIEIILENIKLIIERSEKSESLAENLFETASRNKHLKINECSIPSGILPIGYAGVLYDVRVVGRGPDDKVYRNNKWIRENITRGMTFMKLVKSNKKSFDLVIYANKKFTGGVGDEDEQQPENDDVWQEFCLQTPDKATQVICMTKVNGEAGHFSGRFIDNEFYLFTGSKNVHMVIKDYSDIEKYKESRYAVAGVVAEAVLNALHSMEEDHFECLKHILHQTKMTIVCEVMQPDYQHIVNLSHLKACLINMLSITPVFGGDAVESFTAIPPHLGLILGKSLGLPIPQFESVSIEEVPEKIKQVRQVTEVEGFVLYYMTEDLKTIGLAKVKSVWYVMLRALREKTDYTFNGKSKDASNLEKRIQATEKRFNEIQRWLKFSDAFLQHWKNLGGSFLKWLNAEIKNGGVSSKNIRPKFPIIWKQFLENTENKDSFPIS